MEFVWSARHVVVIWRVSRMSNHSGTPITGTAICVPGCGIAHHGVVADRAFVD